MLGSLGLGSCGSFLAGMASHFPLDLVPHWDIKSIWIDTILTIGGLGALLLLFGNSPVFWGAVGGAIPDLEHLLPLQRRIWPSHGRLHGATLGKAHSAVQVALVAICILVLARVMG